MKFPLETNNRLPELCVVVLMFSAMVVKLVSCWMLDRHFQPPQPAVYKSLVEKDRSHSNFNILTSCTGGIYLFDTINN